MVSDQLQLNTQCATLIVVVHCVTSAMNITGYLELGRKHRKSVIKCLFILGGGTNPDEGEPSTTLYWTTSVVKDYRNMNSF